MTYHPGYKCTSIVALVVAIVASLCYIAMIRTTLLVLYCSRVGVGGKCICSGGADWGVECMGNMLFTEVILLLLAIASECVALCPFLLLKFVCKSVRCE